MHEPHAVHSPTSDLRASKSDTIGIPVNSAISVLPFKNQLTEFSGHLQPNDELPTGSTGILETIKVVPTGEVVIPFQGPNIYLVLTPEELELQKSFRRD